MSDSPLSLTFLLFSLESDGKFSTTLYKIFELSDVLDIFDLNLLGGVRIMSVGSGFNFFASGQALGGHKRAHYHAGSFETVQEEEGATLVQREHSDVLDIFDLNLHTAPEEGGGFKAWCFRL